MEPEEIPDFDNKITAFVIALTTGQMESIHADFNDIQNAWNIIKFGTLIPDTNYELPEWLSYMQAEINFHLNLRKEEIP